MNWNAVASHVHKKRFNWIDFTKELKLWRIWSKYNILVFVPGNLADLLGLSSVLCHWLCIPFQREICQAVFLLFFFEKKGWLSAALRCYPPCVVWNLYLCHSSVCLWSGHSLVCQKLAMLGIFQFFSVIDRKSAGACRIVGATTDFSVSLGKRPFVLGTANTCSFKSGQTLYSCQKLKRLRVGTLEKLKN